MLMLSLHYSCPPGHPVNPHPQISIPSEHLFRLMHAISDCSCKLHQQLPVGTTRHFGRSMCIQHYSCLCPSDMVLRLQSCSLTVCCSKLASKEIWKLSPQHPFSHVDVCSCRPTALHEAI